MYAEFITICKAIMINNNILFTHSYFLRFDPKQWALGQPYPPLGTLYAAAALRAANHSVSLFDSMFANGPEDVIPFLERKYPSLFVICDDGFNYLTKMCLTNMREAAFEMAQLAKKSGCTVVVSSSDATDRLAEYLQHGIDFVVVGEPEQTLVELADVLEQKGNDVSGIAG